MRTQSPVRYRTFRDQTNKQTKDVTGRRPLEALTPGQLPKSKRQLLFPSNMYGNLKRTSPSRHQPIFLIVMTKANRGRGTGQHGNIQPQRHSQRPRIGHK